MADLQVGAIGVDIAVTLRNQSGVIIDMSLTSARFLWLARPHGGKVAKYAATLIGGDTTGPQMKYTTVSADDLPVAGDWTIQAQYSNALGTFFSNVETLKVLPNSF